MHESKKRRKKSKTEEDIRENKNVVKYFLLWLNQALQINKLVKL